MLKSCLCIFFIWILFCCRSVIQTGTVCGIPMTLTGNDLFPRKFSIFYYVFLSFFQIYGGACGIYAMMGNDFEVYLFNLLLLLLQKKALLLRSYCIVSEYRTEL